MEKCKHFCNIHCVDDCPNARCDEFENRFDVPCEDAGCKRIKCKECHYNDKNCTCEDCLFQGDKRYCD